MFSQRQVAMLDECKRAGVHAIIVTPFQSQDGRSDIVGISQRHAGRPDPSPHPRPAGRSVHRPGADTPI